MRSGSPRAIRALTLGILVASGSTAGAGCGARTDLFLDDSPGGGPNPGADGGPGPASDSGSGADSAPGHDSGRAGDASPGRDASQADTGTLDSSRDDAAPDFDVTPPPTCPPDLTPPIYVITTLSNLYAFDPVTARFTFIGAAACPSMSTSYPFSMAVSRDGTAYTVFNDGTLFRIDLATAQCTKTPYEPGQAGFLGFGMGFSANTPAPGETLYVVNADTDYLASIDLSTFILTPIAPVSVEAELTGTLDGRLYAFFPSPSNGNMEIGRVDKVSGRITGTLPLAFANNRDWSFAIAGGSFYTFTSDIEPTTVRLVDAQGDAKVIATMNEVVIGAGVSTCASGN